MVVPGIVLKRVRRFEKAENEQAIDAFVVVERFRFEGVEAQDNRRGDDYNAEQ